MPAEPRSWFRALFLLGALGLGAWLRLRGLAQLPLHGDEYHTLLGADQGYGTILTTFDTVGSHVALPLLQRLAMDVCGAGVLPFRLVAIVPGLLLLGLAYPLLRAFVGADAAALASAALALDPIVVYYSRFARGYLLALLLALVLVWALRRLLEPSRRTRASWGILVVSAALLPWVHLSTLGFLAALALTSLALALRESRALAGRLLLAFAAAGAITLVLFLPVLGQVVTYFRVMEPEPPPLSWMGVPTLLFGGRLAAWVALVLVPLGAWFAWRESRATVWLAAAALLGPLALLLATNPRGLDYAWARYVLSALPLLVALAATAVIALAARARAAGPVGLAIGGALLLLNHWTGPIGPRVPEDGAFSNTYLALHALPAFDEPYPAMPEFYRSIASDPSVHRIIEAPPLLTRSVLLYRNYLLTHGKEVLLGWTGDLPRGIADGPYVRLTGIPPGMADYLVLHKSQVEEVPGYYRFVYEEVWPRVRVPADDTFMLRQETIHPGSFLGAEQINPIAGRLLAEYGPATYKDESLLVWKLAP